MSKQSLGGLVTCIAMLIASMFAAGADERFVRGDANVDGGVDIADAVFVLGHLFAHGRAPACPDAADSNDDGKIDIGDPVACLAYLFAHRVMPPPSPGCGVDPTPDALGACAYESPKCADSREERARATMDAFIASIVDGTPRPDPALLSPAFGFDGYDGPQYLDAVWTADDAVPSETGDGAQLIYRVDDSSFYFYDLLLGGVTVPADDGLPVAAELSLEGALVVGENIAALCESLADFLLQDEGGVMRIIAPGPRWELQIGEPLPASFAFFAGAVLVDAATVYGGDPAPSFATTALARAADAALAIEVVPFVPGGAPAGAVIDLRVTARLFSPGSPSAALYAEREDVVLSQEWLGVEAASAPVLTGTLRVPSDCAAGWYALCVVVESLTGGTVFATERITLPIEVSR